MLNILLFELLVSRQANHSVLFSKYLLLRDFKSVGENQNFWMEHSKGIFWNISPSTPQIKWEGSKSQIQNNEVFLCRIYKLARYMHIGWWLLTNGEHRNRERLNSKSNSNQLMKMIDLDQSGLDHIRIWTRLSILINRNIIHNSKQFR